jgi:O-antigen/teichoic acid export membrane protein
MTAAQSSTESRLLDRLGAPSRLAKKLAGSAQIAKAFRGGAWTMTGYGVQTVLRFISRIVLAKLLVNAAPLGKVAVITTILLGFEMLSDLGINVNIVQHRDGDGGRFLGTARSVMLMRSACIFLVAMAAAFPVASIYHDPELAPLMMFASVGVLCRGFINPGMSVLVRQVSLRGPTLIAIAAELTSFAVTVAWALRAPSAWSLVGGSVASAIVTATASQFVGGRTPFAWDRTFAKTIIHFGGWIVLSTGTYFLSSRGEVLMLKGAVPDITFGCFAFASMLVSTPFSALSQLGSQVLLPFLANWVRAGQQTAQQQFRRVKWAFTALAIVFAAGSLLVSPWLIKLLHFNRSYASLWWMVQCLGVRAAFDVFGLPTSNALLAAGASRYSAFGNAARLVVLVGGLFVALSVYKLGMTGAMWVLMVSPLFCYGALLPGFNRQLPGVLRTEMACLLVFLTVTGAVAGLALALSHAGLLGNF